MVEAGLGISMDNAFSSLRWSGRVKVLPFATEDRLELGMALPSLDQAFPALKKFLEYVKKRCCTQWAAPSWASDS